MEPKKTNKPVHIVMGSGSPKVHPLLQMRKKKRIVSKDVYAKAQGKRLLLCLAAAGFLWVAWAGVQLAVPLASAILQTYPSLLFSGVFRLLVFFTLSILIGMGVFLMGRRSVSSLKHAARLDPGVPLTRANTADLPAPESLVRASEKPVQEQETVLLRAATETQERQEEQLLRPREQSS